VVFSPGLFPAATSLHAALHFIEEFDRNGKRVWHHQLADGYVLAARRR
jgi:hypothetical protein